MTIKIEKFSVTLRGFDEVTDITGQIGNIISSSESKEGLINITTDTPGVAVMSVEYDTELFKKIPEIFEKFVSNEINYEQSGFQNNQKVFANLKSLVAGGSLTLPFYEGKIQLFQNQRIITADFTKNVKTTQIIVTMTY